MRAQGLTVVNVDVRELPSVDIVRDLEGDFSDIGTFDGLFCSYLAEHISWRNIVPFFENCSKILKPNGAAVFIVPNTREQMKVLLEKETWTIEDSQFIFGDQDYKENAHRVAFSKELITQLLLMSGFQKVKLTDHPDPNARDLIVTAYNQPQLMENFNLDRPAGELYTREYFEDGTIGYIGYRDFEVHYKLAEEIASMNPESVLDVGGARGYIVKKVEALGIPAICMDISEHAWHTRATDSFVLHDAEDVPWPFEDNQFDLLTSFAFLEHIKEENLEGVLREMVRVSKRGFHNISFEKTPEDIDVTHVTFRPQKWWEERFNSIHPNYEVRITGKEWFDEVQQRPMPQFGGERSYLNIGSWQNMFHGWDNVDIQDLSVFARHHGFAFHQMDVRQGLPITPNSVKLIVSHHLIEHLNREEGLKFLKDCFNIMAPGAVIRLSAPDAEKIIGKLGNLKRSYAEVNVGVVQAEDEYDALFRILFDGHETMFNGEGLVKMMEAAGFTGVRVMDFNVSRSEVIEHETVDSFPSLSVFCEGMKPNPRGLLPTAKDEALLRYLNEAD
jgi:predicted SAM-dependent methyltransferase